MLVCNCRGINERKVAEALDAGVRHWHGVHAHFGTTPCCGKCSVEIRQSIAERTVAECGSAAPMVPQAAAAKQV